MQLTAAFSLIESAFAILDKDDTIIDHSSKVSRNMHCTMHCYREILQGEKSKSYTNDCYSTSSMYLRTSQVVIIFIIIISSLAVSVDSGAYLCNFQ